MTHDDHVDPGVVDAYRRRRAPRGFAARVTSRAAGMPRRTSPLVWQSAAAVGLAAGSALVFLLVTRAPAPTEPGMTVPPAPDFWAEISVPTDPPVSGLTDFGSIPQLPPRPDFEEETEPSEHRSSAPRRDGTQLTRFTRQEIIHEAV